MCSALEGLSREERQKEGLTTAVTKLAFVTSFVLPEGVSLQDAVGGFQDDWIIDEVSKNIFPDLVKKLICVRMEI